MPIPLKYAAPFEPGAYYHIICKSLPNQRLFLKDENKRFFLERFGTYLSAYLDTYSYILLDTHCHFLLRVRSFEEIKNHILSIPIEKLSVFQRKYLHDNSPVLLDLLVERQFNSFFVSYTRSLNTLYNLKGRLFDSPFRRILIEDEKHLHQLMIYIHANAVHDQLVKTIEEHKWSSYHNFIQGMVDESVTGIVMTLFGGKERFVALHQIQTTHYYSFEE